MRKLKYIGDTDELTTNGKIYSVKTDGTFIDDTNSECCLGDNYEEYFEEIMTEDEVLQSHKQIFIDYVNEFAWKFAQLWNTELTHEQKMDRIGETFKLPAEFVNDWFK